MGLLFTNVFICLSFQLLLVDKKVSEVKEVLSLSGALIEHYKGSPTQKESLNVFFLVLQVCHYLMAGQVSTDLIIVTLDNYLHTMSVCVREREKEKLVFWCIFLTTKINWAAAAAAYTWFILVIRKTHLTLVRFSLEHTHTHVVSFYKHTCACSVSKFN